MSKIKVSETQFLEYRIKSNLSEKTLDIAYNVLVLNKPYKDVASNFSISKGAVSQNVSRVIKDMNISLIPKGFVRITVVLPEHQAYQVRLWEDKALNKIKEIQRNESNISSTTKGRCGQD